MDENLKLTIVQVGDDPLFYIPSQQRQRTVTAGGEVYGASEFDVKSTSDYVDLGAGQVTRTTANEMPVMVNGQLTFIPRITESVPQIVGAKGAVAPIQAPSTPLQERTIPGATPVPTGEESTVPEFPGPTPRTPPAPPAPAPQTLAPSSARGILGLQPSQHRLWTQIAIPVREAMSQAFGSPDHPEFQGLAEYAHLADDPDASRAIANAINVSLNHLDEQKEAHGGLMNLLRYKSGVPQSLARAYVESMRQVAVEPLEGHPEWQRAYDSTMAVYAVIMGMRAAIRAPASEFTAKSLEREVPIGGLYVGNSQQFYNKLSQIALEIDNVTKTIPDEIMARDEKQYIHDKVGEMMKKSREGTIRPPSEKRKSLDNFFKDR